MTQLPTLVRFPDAAPGKATTQQTTMDSSFIVRMNLAARALDTVAPFKTVKINQVIGRDEDGRMTSMKITPDILPVIDDWTVCGDGTIAIVLRPRLSRRLVRRRLEMAVRRRRCRSSGSISTTTKTALIDSALAAIKARRDSMDAVIASRGGMPIGAAGAAVGGGAAVAVGGRGRGAGDGSGAPPPQLIDGRPALTDLPDYRPAFLRGSERGPTPREISGFARRRS